MYDIVNLLPGLNCGVCGYRNCRDFGDALYKKKADLAGCHYLKTENFAANLPKILAILNDDKTLAAESQRMVGVIDNLKADFIISNLPGEISCREDIYPFDQKICINEGEYVRYRPLGCPITHFAKVLKANRGILTIHLVGPLHRLDANNKISFEDVGVCMVAAFQGIVIDGRVPVVGQTVKFIPSHCMMQKVHSGVVVHSEGNMVRIEGIDLKVW